ncbi:aldolase/citrate lyase family protein [Paraburkholderia sp. SEWSISQ10-3 4]|uniref:HpcH/HpaI aldolase family protein n=1 Tax=Paraburkholderia TaxID=1822464 RepID=UPI00225B162D|nr:MULTISPECIES: aldolase/citrate lyase family protein [Paraburkholderia]MCX4140723.1 aldolase/citrate lyase family protein [Paraburkholderia aspalathi]MDN7173407.1 aldolase/citrate lyase family protein [Paraburkholderia sp. SEWSISQ10-3 4]MDQ6503048.1 aldolase/citrate lyase family protein [Paraburkholderia aspalathi]
MSKHQPDTNAFRTLLDQPAPPLGTWLMAGTPSNAEALGHGGFDWLLIDMEHGPIDFRDTWQMLQAVDCTPATPIVRVSTSDDPALVKRALDLGARTLMFPYVQSAEQARRIVASAKYPPLGQRGFAGVHRASRYGTFSDYGKLANDLTTCIVQLETPEAIDRLEEIAAVEGVDALFIGPGDLSAALGCMGNLQDERVQTLMRSAAQRARAVGMPIGTLGPSPEMVKSFVEMGYDYVAVGSDLVFMMQQAKAILARMKGCADHAPLKVAY